MKALKAIFITLGCLVGAFVVLLIVSAILYSPEYVIRVIGNGESKITDYQIFPSKVIVKSTTPYKYEYNPDDSIGSLEVTYAFKGKPKTSPLDKLAAGNGTTSLIVIHQDKVVNETYFNGYNKDSIETSFSSVKSLDSLMIGMAIEDGFIQSEDQPISDFIPEFKDTEFGKITIKQLLMMRSNIRYEEGLAWFTDDAKTYYMPDLRDLALHHMSIDEKYSGQFHYNNYHPLLLGIILERSTKMSVSDYFQKKIWDKIGAESDASWSLDSPATRFEKMESGLNFKSIDYAKIGSMLLHHGFWNGQHVVDQDWLDRSLIAPQPLAPADIDTDFIKNKNVGYQYMWYSTANAKDGHDFYSAGKYGQYIYVSPENDTVIVRTGKSEGQVDWWPDVLKQIAAYTGSR